MEKDMSGTKSNAHQFCRGIRLPLSLATSTAEKAVFVGAYPESDYTARLNQVTRGLDFVQFGKRKGSLLLAWESNAVLSCPVSLL